jgi:hypothetical protein
MGSSPVGCKKTVRDVMVTCPFWVREIEGSNPSVLNFFILYTKRNKKKRGCIAQLVERWPFKPRVLGSSPGAPIVKKNRFVTLVTNFFI